MGTVTSLVFWNSSWIPFTKKSLRKMKPQTVLFYFGIIVVLVIASVEGDGKAVEDKKDDKDKKEVKLVGQYQLVTDPDNDDFGDYLRAMGFSEEAQKEIKDTKKILITISKANKTTKNVKTLTKGKTREMNFESGKEFQTRLADGRKVMNTITINKEDKSAMRVIKMNGFEATNEAKFCKDGFNVTLKAHDAEAVLIFKRLEEHPDLKTFMEKFAKKFFS